MIRPQVAFEYAMGPRDECASRRSITFVSTKDSEVVEGDSRVQVLRPNRSLLNRQGTLVELLRARAIAVLLGRVGQSLQAGDRVQVVRAERGLSNREHPLPKFPDSAGVALAHIR